MEGTRDEHMRPFECGVGQLTHGNSRKGKSASQQYMENGKMRSSRPFASLMDCVHPVTQQQRPLGEAQPPTIQSPSIQMIAVNGINSAGRNVWWEEVRLQVVEKGRKPYPLPTLPGEACVLVPSVNQSLLQKGITVDQVSLYRRECNGPAARFMLVPAHNSCGHSNPIFQKRPGTRIGYALLMPVNLPPPPPGGYHHTSEEDEACLAPST